MLLKTFSKNQGALFLLPRCIGKKKKKHLRALFPMRMNELRDLLERGGHISKHISPREATLQNRKKTKAGGPGNRRLF